MPQRFLLIERKHGKILSSTGRQSFHGVKTALKLVVCRTQGIFRRDAAFPHEIDCGKKHIASLFSTVLGRPGFGELVQLFADLVCWTFGIGPIKAGAGGAAVLVDPAWTATGAMTNLRAFHSQTLLANGKVLITGLAQAGMLLLVAAVVFRVELPTEPEK